MCSGCARLWRNGVVEATQWLAGNEYTYANDINYGFHMPQNADKLFIVTCSLAIMLAFCQSFQGNLAYLESLWLHINTSVNTSIAMYCSWSYL